MAMGGAGAEAVVDSRVERTKELLGLGCQRESVGQPWKSTNIRVVRVEDKDVYIGVPTMELVATSSNSEHTFHSHFHADWGISAATLFGGPDVSGTHDLSTDTHKKTQYFSLTVTAKTPCILRHIGPFEELTEEAKHKAGGGYIASGELVCGYVITVTATTANEIKAESHEVKASFSFVDWVKGHLNIDAAREDTSFSDRLQIKITAFGDYVPPAGTDISITTPGAEKKIMEIFRDLSVRNKTLGKMTFNDSNVIPRILKEKEQNWLFYYRELKRQLDFISTSTMLSLDSIGELGAAIREIANKKEIIQTKIHDLSSGYAAAEDEDVKFNKLRRDLISALNKFKNYAVVIPEYPIRIHLKLEGKDYYLSDQSGKLDRNVCTYHPDVNLALALHLEAGRAGLQLFFMKGGEKQYLKVTHTDAEVGRVSAVADKTQASSWKFSSLEDGAEAPYVRLESSYYLHADTDTALAAPIDKEGRYFLSEACMQTSALTLQRKAVVTIEEGRGGLNQQLQRDIIPALGAIDVSGKALAPLILTPLEEISFKPLPIASELEIMRMMEFVGGQIPGGLYARVQSIMSFIYQLPRQETAVSKEYSVILGNTGAGKSTLTGLLTQNYITKDIRGDLIIGDLSEYERQLSAHRAAKIGDNTRSTTKLAHGYEGRFIYLDCPGFKDRVEADRAPNYMGIHAALRRAGRIKAVTVVINAESVGADAGASFEELAVKLSEIFDPEKLEENAHSFVFVVNRVYKRDTLLENIRTHYENMSEDIAEFDALYGTAVQAYKEASGDEDNFADRLSINRVLIQRAVRFFSWAGSVTSEALKSFFYSADLGEKIQKIEKYRKILPIIKMMLKPDLTDFHERVVFPDQVSRAEIEARIKSAPGIGAGAIKFDPLSDEAREFKQNFGIIVESVRKYLEERKNFIADVKVIEERLAEPVSAGAGVAARENKAIDAEIASLQKIRRELSSEEKETRHIMLEDETYGNEFGPACWRARARGKYKGPEFTDLTPIPFPAAKIEGEPTIKKDPETGEIEFSAIFRANSLRTYLVKKDNATVNRVYECKLTKRQINAGKIKEIDERIEKLQQMRTHLFSVRDLKYLKEIIIPRMDRNVEVKRLCEMILNTINTLGESFFEPFEPGDKKYVEDFLKVLKQHNSLMSPLLVDFYKAYFPEVRLELPGCLEAQNQYRSTPLTVAVDYLGKKIDLEKFSANQLQLIIEALVNLGADPSAKNGHGNNAVDLVRVHHLDPSMLECPAAWISASGITTATSARAGAGAAISVDTEAEVRTRRETSHETAAADLSPDPVNAVEASTSQPGLVRTALSFLGCCCRRRKALVAVEAQSR